MIRTLLFVAIGGAAGSCLRYLAGRLAFALHGVPLWCATLGVNIIGCLLIGFFTVMAQRHNLVGTDTAAMLTVGLCGGLTTFSTFSAETVTLAENGAWLTAFLYVLASLTSGFAAIFLGRALARFI